MIRVLLFCVAASLLYAQGGASVEGHVSDSVRGGGIARAIVTLRPAVSTEDSDNYITRTDGNGRFAIANIVPGNYVATASKEGYAPPSGTPPQPLALEPGQHAVVELKLAPLGVIAGRVLDQDGEPLSNAIVQATHWIYVSGKKQLAQVYGATSDDRGEYRIFDVRPGRYFLVASHSAPSGPAQQWQTTGNGRLEPGQYAPRYYPNARDPAQASPLEVTPGVEFRDMDIRLSPELVYSVRGKITLRPEDNSSLSLNIRSRANSGSPPVNGSWTSTLDSGFVFTSVPNGSYLITATLHPRNGAVPAQVLQAVEVNGHDVDGVELAFRAGVQVSGRVITSGSGDAVFERVGVRLRSDEPLPMGTPSAVVKPDGTLVMENVFPGQYHVTVNPAPGTYLKAVQVANRDVPDQKIDASRLSSGLVIVLGTDPGRIDGTVLRSNGAPLAFAAVMLIADQGRPDWEEVSKTASSDAKGVFSIRDIAPGDYKLYSWINAEPGAPLDPDFRRPFEEKATAVKVEPNGKLKIELKAIDASGAGH